MPTRQVGHGEVEGNDTVDGQHQRRREPGEDEVGDLAVEGGAVEAAFPCNLVRNDAGMVLCVAIDANSSGICFVELHFGFAIELLDFLGEIIGLGGWGGRSEKSGPYVYFNDENKLVRDTAKGRGGHHGPQHPR